MGCFLVGIVHLLGVLSSVFVKSSESLTSHGYRCGILHVCFLLLTREFVFYLYFDDNVWYLCYSLTWCMHTQCVFVFLEIGCFRGVNIRPFFFRLRLLLLCIILIPYPSRTLAMWELAISIS